MGMSSFWRSDIDAEISGVFETCDGILLGDNAIVLTYVSDENTIPSLYWAEEAEGFQLGFKSYCFKGVPAYSAFNHKQRPDFFPQVKDDWDQSVQQESVSDSNSTTHTASSTNTTNTNNITKTVNTTTIHNSNTTNNTNSSGISSNITITEFGFDNRTESRLVKKDFVSVLNRVTGGDNDDIGFDQTRKSVMEKIASNSRFVYEKNVLDLYSFKYSIYPVLYLITVSLTTMLVLTLVVYLKPRKSTNKYSTRLFLCIGTALASGNFLRLVVMIIKMIKVQHETLGTCSATQILDYIWNDTTFNILQYIAGFIFRIAQIQNIMRLFDRKVEKRYVLSLSVLLILVHQVLDGVLVFHNMHARSELAYNGNGSFTELLAPAVYITGVSISICYAVVVCWNMFVNRYLCFQRKNDMFFITLLTLCSVLLQPCFFVVDISNIWVDHASISFYLTCTVAASVMVWDWIDRLKVLRRAQEAQSILGRPVYIENEIYESGKMVKYGKNFMEVLKNIEHSSEGNNDNKNQRDDDDDGSDGDNDAQGLKSAESAMTTSTTTANVSFWRKCSDALENLVDFTDELVLSSLSSQNSDTSSSFSHHSTNIYMHNSRSNDLEYDFFNAEHQGDRREHNNTYKMKSKTRKHLNLGQLKREHFNLKKKTQEYQYNKDYNETKIGTELNSHRNGNNNGKEVYMYSTKEVDFEK